MYITFYFRLNEEDSVLQNKTDFLTSQFFFLFEGLSLGHYTDAYQEEQEQYSKCTLRILRSVN